MKIQKAWGCRIHHGNRRVHPWSLLAQFLSMVMAPTSLPVLFPGMQGEQKLESQQPSLKALLA